MSRHPTKIPKAVRPPRLKEQREFWLQYEPAPGSGAYTQTLHALYRALYFLPENYKLMILTQNPFYEMALAEYRDLVRRVLFDPRAIQLDNTTQPSAVIYDEAVSGRPDNAPLMIVREKADQALSRERWDRFIISADNPEALATAALKIARDR